MATHYVDSAAGGANNGTSWGDAWTSFTSSVGTAGAGDTILIDDGHSESLGSSSWTHGGTKTNPLRVVSVDKADDSLSIGATINGTATLEFNGSVYVYGVTVSTSSSYAGASNTGGHYHCFEKCTLVGPTVRFGASGGQTKETVLIDTAVTVSSVGQWVQFQGSLRWYGGSVTQDCAGFYLYDGCSCYIEGVDLSLLDSQIFVFYNGLACGKVTLAHCSIHANVALQSGIADVGQECLMFHCDSGTSADPSYRTELANYRGTISADAGRYRTGGATDGERTSPYSWALASNANTAEIYLPFMHSLGVSRWTNGNGSTEYTYTIYLASGGTLQDDEVWVQWTLPNNTDTTATAAIVSTKLDPQGTPANLTSDTESTWNGTGVGTKQKISVAYTPDKPGLVTARVFVGKPSTTVYVDPRIDISPLLYGNARSFPIPGHGNVYESDLASGSGALVHNQYIQPRRMKTRRFL